MRTPKWLFLAYLVLSIWVMDKFGVLQIIQREYAAFSARRTIEQYLASTGVRKLQIGAGPNNLLVGLIQTLSHEKDKPFSTL